jgi:hypothetical protein
MGSTNENVHSVPSRFIAATQLMVADKPEEGNVLLVAPMHHSGPAELT